MDPDPFLRLELLDQVASHLAHSVLTDAEILVDLKTIYLAVLGEYDREVAQL